MTSDPLPQLRLLQLVSPTLPVGAFAYSQGLEWAVHSGWVDDEASLNGWLHSLINDCLGLLDLPVLIRLHKASAQNDRDRFARWARYLLASRETHEMREEESTRARALSRLLLDLELPQVHAWREEMAICQAAPFAAAATHWKIDAQQAALGYAFGWLENQVTAGVKLIPLGQTAGQRLQLQLAENLPDVVANALRMPDDDIGASAPAQALASCHHETQYTRLFRS